MLLTLYIIVGYGLSVLGLLFLGVHFKEGFMTIPKNGYVQFLRVLLHVGMDYWEKPLNNIPRIPKLYHKNKEWLDTYNTSLCPLFWTLFFTFPFVVLCLTLGIAVSSTIGVVVGAIYLVERTITYFVGKVLHKTPKALKHRTLFNAKKRSNLTAVICKQENRDLWRSNQIFFTNMLTTPNKKSVKEYLALPKKTQNQFRELLLSLRYSLSSSDYDLNYSLERVIDNIYLLTANSPAALKLIYRDIENNQDDIQLVRFIDTMIKSFEASTVKQTWQKTKMFAHMIHGKMCPRVVIEE